MASEADYTRGALYHLFANKEDLAPAVVAWVEETWWAEGANWPADADSARPSGADRHFRPRRQLAGTPPPPAKARARRLIPSPRRPRGRQH
ncbi:MAG: TetR family transcriptional regulator, partial [Acidimicrobiia bacterium]